MSPKHDLSARPTWPESVEPRHRFWCFFTTTRRIQAHAEGVLGSIWRTPGPYPWANVRMVHLSMAMRYWPLPTGRPLAAQQGHTGGVRSLALCADGRLLAGGGFDGTVRLWETSSGSCLRTLRPQRRY